MSKGKLLYVMGPSGSGKDSIIQYVKNVSEQHSTPLVVMHRYITRPHDSGGEHHIEVSDHGYNMRQSLGLFAMDWQANGLKYGIGIELNAYLEKGIAVIVNGSRSYLPTAQQHYPHIIPVLIQVDAHLLRERLQQRGRESTKEIEERIQRSEHFDRQEITGVLTIFNNHTIEEAGKHLLKFLDPDFVPNP
jgi:ribose 1,5-bisphosphokinase